MSQWGKATSFTTQHFSVKLLPHVDTGADPFCPINAADSSHIVDGILVLHANGVQVLIDKVVAGARARCIGRPYSEWLELAAQVEK